METIQRNRNPGEFLDC